MAGSTVRAQLLVEAKQRRAAAGKKLSRLRQAGVNTSSLDVRASNTALESMSPRQLRSHIGKLNAFTSRSTQYVPGLKGTPLNAATWRQYQKLETRYNATSKAYYERIKNLSIPGLNTTIEQRLDELSKSRRAGDYRSFNEFHRTAANITGQDALRKLVQQMEKRDAPDYIAREAKLERVILNKMLRRTGNRDLQAKIRDMDDEDLLTLTQYTDFLPALESSYAMAKSTSSDTPLWQSTVYEDNEDKIRELADWAHRKFGDKSEQDPDAKPGPQRDRYGRFVKKDTPNPKPEFVRDERGKFAPRHKR